MADAFTTSVHISRRPDEVWAGLTDWARAPAWMAGIEALGPDGDGPPGQGSRLRFRARGAERTSTIATWAPPAHLVLRSAQGGISATYSYALVPDGEGTRLTLTARCEAHGLGWRLLSPLVRHLVRRTDSGQPAALKRLLETDPA